MRTVNDEWDVVLTDFIPVILSQCALCFHIRSYSILLLCKNGSQRILGHGKSVYIRFSSHVAERSLSAELMTERRSMIVRLSGGATAERCITRFACIRTALDLNEGLRKCEFYPYPGGRWYRWKITWSLRLIYLMRSMQTFSQRYFSSGDRAVRSQSSSYGP